MTDPNDTINPIRTSDGSQYYGLTKREHFAGLALQGILASGSDYSPETNIKWAVNSADLLIKELNKPTDETSNSN